MKCLKLLNYLCGKKAVDEEDMTKKEKKKNTFFKHHTDEEDKNDYDSEDEVSCDENVDNSKNKSKNIKEAEIEMVTVAKSSRSKTKNEPTKSKSVPTPTLTPIPSPQQTRKVPGPKPIQSNSKRNTSNISSTNRKIDPSKKLGTKGKDPKVQETQLPDAKKVKKKTRFRFVYDDEEYLEKLEKNSNQKQIQELDEEDF